MSSVLPFHGVTRYRLRPRLTPEQRRYRHLSVEARLRCLDEGDPFAQYEFGWTESPRAWPENEGYCWLPAAIRNRYDHRGCEVVAEI